MVKVKPQETVLIPLMKSTYTERRLHILKTAISVQKNVLVIPNCYFKHYTVNSQLQVNWYSLPYPEELFTVLHGRQKFNTGRSTPQEEEV